ncbi:MAG: hypothetical protein LBT80_06580 [Lactobacillaceae bacterium]|jgi:hypothetical protein|nr:hypothetical protein [Lactobacillaceae bacterium]
MVNKTNTKVNWVKIGSVADKQASVRDVLEAWLAGNTELQVLAKYTVTATALAPTMKNELAVAYLIKWRKALTQFKGKWQWRDVETYAYIDIVPSVAKVEPTPAPVVETSEVPAESAGASLVETAAVVVEQSAQPVVAVVAAPVSEVIAESVVAEVTESTVNVVTEPVSVASSSSAASENVVASSVASLTSIPVSTAAVRTHQPIEKRPEQPKFAKTNQSVEGSIKKRFEKRDDKPVATSGNKPSPTTNRQPARKPYSEQRELVYLTGMETRKQPIYGRRHLGLRIVPTK